MRPCTDLQPDDGAVTRSHSGGGGARLLLLLLILTPALLAQHIAMAAFLYGEESRALRCTRLRRLRSGEDPLEQCARRHSRGNSPSQLASMRDVQAERGTGFERCLTARGVTAFLTGEWLGQDRQVITLGIVQRDGGHRFLGHGEPRAADVARECGAGV